LKAFNLLLLYYTHKSCNDSGVDKIKTQHLEKRKWLGNIKNTMLKVSDIIIYKKEKK
jgi:hypothetical protein